MEPNLQRRVQRYGWDKAAAHYEAFWAAQLRPAHDLLLDLAELASGHRVVDVACGTGLVTLRAAERIASAGRIVGTDLSDRMVSLAREEAGRRGLAVEYRRMDAESLDLTDSSFDVGLCALGLMYVPDPRRALAELQRVLAPGGRAVASVWGARSNCGWAEIFPIVESRVASEVCPLFFGLGGGDALALTFEAAGFSRVRSERISTVLEYGSADEAIGAAFAGGPVALAYSRFDEPTRASAHAEYLASIEPYRRGSGYQVPGEFVVTRGERM